MNETEVQVNPYDATMIAETGVVRPFARKSSALSIYCGFLGWAVLAGVAVAIWPNPSPIFSIVLNIPFVVLLIMWCQNDADSFDLTIGKWTKLGLIFLFPLALIIHFFRTRGLWGMLSIILAVLFGGVLVLVLTIAMVCTHFIMYRNLTSL